MKPEGKELFHNQWVSLWDKDGYIYSTETRAEGEGVAILVYKGDDEVLGRFEICPAHSDETELCSITGGVEKGDHLSTAVHELKEEAGIDAAPEELEYLGTVRPSKSANTVMHLYALDGTNKTLGEALGDGSEGEKGAYCKWVPTPEAVLSKDPLIAAMILRRYGKQK